MLPLRVAKLLWTRVLKRSTRTPIASYEVGVPLYQCGGVSYTDYKVYVYAGLQFPLV